MAILFGMGRPSLVTTIEGKQRLLTFEPMSFQLATNTDVVKSTKYNTLGQIVTAGSAQRAVNSVLTMDIEAITWMSMQIAHGEIASTSTNLEVPELRFYTLPATGLQEISDADITTIDKVSAAVYNDSFAESLVPMSTGTPGAGQFTVAAGKITVGPGPAGVARTIGYRVLKVVPTCQSLGVEDGAAKIGKLRFDGILTTDDERFVTKIIIPELSREQEPSLDIQSPTKLSLVYTLIVQAGKPRPYQLLNIPIA